MFQDLAAFSFVVLGTSGFNVLIQPRDLPQIPDEFMELTATGSSSSSCSAKVSWTKKSVFNGFDKYEVFGVPAFCEVGGNKNKCQHMLSVLAAYIDNNNDGCPDNPPAFLNNIKKATLPAEEPGVGAVILTKQMSFTMPAGFQKYYGLTMWEDETRPECSGTQATDSCRDASLEEVFQKYYG